MKRIFTATAAMVALVAGAVQAQSVTGGAYQLAKSLGVAPGDHSVAQLTQMRSALEDGDMTTFRYIRDNLRIGGFSTKAQPSAGRIAFAEKIEVDPTSMSFADMYRLSLATSTAQPGPVAAFWKNRDPSNPSRRASYVSQGEAQIAAGLGVDPADYTLAELTRMKAAADSD
ncbi:hypothetical protein [Rhodovulum euryhalinum]|uniref:Uncharacterized protein n=1 Tax=Rhodovulum euryhalinum TaxID=35805 RepID=A0A4R2KD99_9RHOB|nr:hypothetical protein [Rhodovulum euryhalinum]TCO70282.1 hypothetical protein EV655_11047 [Rhodovulum euryhalinum]